MGLFSKLFGMGGSKLHVGETIAFGPFKWRVLATDGEEALLITEDVIDCAWYQRPMQRYGKVRWEECSLRNYLNGRFIAENFTDEQIKCMRRTVLPNDPDPYKSSNEANPSLCTKDVVFCLSISEAWEFFDKPSERKAKASSRAIEAGVRTGFEGCSPWWLRSDLSMEDGAFVTDRGAVSSNWIDYAGQNGLGVRPAVIIDQNDYKRLTAQ